MLKKIVLAMFGLAFAFSMTSCKYEDSCSEEKKSDKTHSEKHHDRW